MSCHLHPVCLFQSDLRASYAQKKKGVLGDRQSRDRFFKVEKVKAREPFRTGTGSSFIILEVKKGTRAFFAGGGTIVIIIFLLLDKALRGWDRREVRGMTCRKEKENSAAKWPNAEGGLGLLETTFDKG